MILMYEDIDEFVVRPLWHLLLIFEKSEKSEQVNAIEGFKDL